MSVINSLNKYPAQAEDFWIQRAEKLTGLSGQEALEKITPAVARLSDLFTTERPIKNFPDYFAEADLLVGYGLFFLPQSFIRTTHALRFVTEARGWKCPSSPLRILDLGAGPGSCGVACAHYFKELGGDSVELVAVDRSAMALATLEEFAQAVLGDSVKVTSRVGDAQRSETWPEGPFDIILAGFVMNEMKTLSKESLLEWVESLQSHLTPAGMIIILEPALKVTSNRLQYLSDGVASQKIITRIGPDLDAHPCPQLAEGIHWSHEVRHWQAPPSTDFINRKLHRDLREVRFSFAAFSDQAIPPLSHSVMRIISDIQIIKGLVRFIVSQQGQVQTVEIPTRGLSKHEVKEYAARLERGDLVSHAQPAASKVRLNHPADLSIIWSAKS